MLTTATAIEQAAVRVKGTVIRTPLVDVSWRAGRALWLKCENLQVTGSFKLRGAVNMISSLPADQRRRGVITYSSGNHAQAVAYAARRYGIRAVVVMPLPAPAVKVDGARRLGAEIVLQGTTSVERRARAEQLASEESLTMVPPFDHPSIIAGQGTVGLEVLDDLPSVTRILVPLGGGGLLSGLAAAIKARRPAVEVVGVEPSGAAKMTASLAAGHPVTLPSAVSVADGLLPVRPGDLTFAHVQALVDRIETVDDRSIEEAMVWLFDQARLVVEPSGAAAVAVALRETGPHAEATVAVLSGGNVAATSLRQLLDRHESGRSSSDSGSEPSSPEPSSAKNA